MQLFQKIINKTTQGPYWVMYDNDCSFCSSIMRFFKRFDMFNKVQWVPKDWKGDFPDNYKQKISKTIVVYDPSSNLAYYRSEAVYKIIRCIPFGILFAWILKISFLIGFYDRVYDKVSNHRNKICKQTKK